MSVSLSGIREITSLVESCLDADEMRRLNHEIGEVVRQGVSDHLARASVSRHKTAQRLNATPTRFLEYAANRVVATDTEDGAEITIQNTPGLRRAFGPLTITPKKARALTIPLHRVSYAKRVADLRGEGHDVFRPKGTNILAENVGKGKRARLRPLYALVKRTVVPQDRGLLPLESEIKEWALDAADAFLA